MLDFHTLILCRHCTGSWHCSDNVSSWVSESATKIHNLLPGEVQFFHSHFNSRSHQSQNQWLLEYLNSNCSRLSSHHSYHICGKPVCQKLWLSILNLSPTSTIAFTLYSLKARSCWMLATQGRFLLNLMRQWPGWATTLRGKVNITCKSFVHLINTASGIITYM